MHLFPATARLPGAPEGARGLLARVRVEVRGDRLLIFSEATGKVRKLLDETLIESERGMTSWGSSGYRFAVSSGEIEAAQEGGCGCGSKLKQIRVEDYL